MFVDASCNWVVINDQEKVMRQSTETYTRRQNARRAGVAAGIKSEKIAITVHKSAQGVRFGWRESDATVKPNVTTSAPSGVLLERNGVRRPKPGGVCAAVWEWLDGRSEPKLCEAMEVGGKRKWNLNNVSCEFYRWRKFCGIKRSRKSDKNTDVKI